MNTLDSTILVLHKHYIKENIKNYYPLTDTIYSKEPPTIIGKTKVLIYGKISNLNELIDKFSINCNVESNVIGELFNKYGKKIFESIEGKYSIVIVNENSIYFFRDYFGSASLYYVNNQNYPLIISNKIIGIGTYIKLEINEEFLPHYFLYDDHTNWLTIYRNINSVPMFEFLEYNIQTNLINGHFLGHSPFSHNMEITYKKNELFSNIESLIEKNIKSFMHLFSVDSMINMMSGGVDSAYIAVLLNKLGIRDSVSASYENFGNDYEYAKDVANYLNSNHKNINIIPSNFYQGIVDSIKKTEMPYAFKGESFFNTIFEENKNSKNLFINGTGADAIFSYGRELKILKLIQKNSNLVKVINTISGKIFNPHLYQLVTLLVEAHDKNFVSKDLLKFYYNIHTNKENHVKQILELSTLPAYFENEIEIINKNPTNIADKILRIHAFYGMIRIPNVISQIAEQTNAFVLFPFLNKKLFNLMLSIPFNERIILRSKKYYLKNILVKKLPKEFVYRKKIMMDVPFTQLFINDKNFVSLIEEIKDAKYNFFNINFDNVFNSSSNEKLALKLINFHLVNKLVINN